MLLVLSLYLCFSLPVVRCTRYNLMKNKVCQWPAECYWISLVLIFVTGFLFVLIFSLPIIRCTRYNLMKKVCQWPEEYYWFSLCTYIFTSIVRCTRYNLKIITASVTWGMLLVFSLYLYFFTSHGQVYSIQPYEIKCINNLWNVTGFLFVLMIFTSRGQVYSI